ncbi:hypothetical protein OSB04_001976 [Centaurea solstitialis]|uniref:Integrase catalytic domain-containing protein n=1 Tax=Centaurea solstitialis TaxID=347529 RepID=A0AA38TS14_9ASTR|nr:hypothetical protein OSB04_001976 [Centaurea solstitialis]
MTTSTPSDALTSPTASQLVFTLTNVYPQFSFKLSSDGSKYKLWRRIFKDVCKGAKVYGHITGKSKPASDDDEDWEAIDSRIKSWFYSTCDANLLQIISSDNCTAKDLWDKLDEFFLNNKMSRMLQLQEQFRNTKKGTLSITDFCHSLKNLADALVDCDSKINEVELVMQILRQLPPSYHSIVDVITNTKPFPSFLEAKNMLLLHESREESVEPHTDTPLTSSAALYSSAQSASNGKSKNKSNRGNQGHSQAYFGNTATPGHAPPSQSGLLGAPPAQPFGVGPPQPSPAMFSTPQQLPASTFHQPPVMSHPYYYGLSQSHHPVSVPNQFAPPMPSSIQVPPPPQQPFGGHASQYSQPQYTDLSSVFQAMSVQAPQDNNFYMDTGATRHMTFNQGTMHSLTPCNSNFIQVGNGAVVPASYIGQCNLPFSPWPLKLKNVLVSDKLIKNLISVKRFTIDNSVSVEFDPFGFTVKDLKTGSFLQRCDSDHHDLYPVLPASSPSVPASAHLAVSFDVWHRRLGHPGAAVFQFLLSRKFIECSSQTSSLCHACQLGKHCRLPFTSSSTKTSRVFELIHSDLWTSPITSLSGFKYYVLFLDDFSHFLWVFPLRAKSEVFSIFKTFRAYVLNQFKTDIQLFQCDNGREFNNQPFLDFFKTHGIKIRFSCPYTSPQNGKAERTIRTINNTIRTSLIQASLPPTFWVEALLSSVHTFNLLPSTTIQYKTPFEMLFGFFPSYSHLRVFGCLCYPNTSPTAPHKLAPRSSACVYLGPSPDHRGYRCLDLITQKVIISRHVVFDETHFPFPDFQPRPSSEEYDSFDIDESLPSLSPIVNTSSPPPADGSSTSVSSSPPPSAETTNATSTSSAPAAPSGHPMTTRSRTGSLKPKQIFNLSVTSDISPIPRSTAQAMCDPNWRAAMDAEMTALLSNHTWDLVPKPSAANIVGRRWLFRHKFDSNGRLERYKARLVAQGFSQQPGLDFDDTFSPVVKPATIRTVLSISISRNWPIHQLDVKNAFLHGDLTETVYMSQPPGYVDSNFPDHVCRLRKALYGLKQAPRAWYQRFAVYLSSLGFISSKTDTSLFTYHRGSDTIYLLLYVDDIILTASSPSLISRVIYQLSSEFPMSDLGPLSFFLGIAASRSKSGLFLSQTAFAQEILARADMVSCNPCSTPADTKTKLAVDGEPVSDPTLYRSLAGALQYLTFTRPDIAYAVQQVCLFMHDPRLPHFNALKRILRYLKGTLSHGLHIKASAVDRLVAYSDADWAGCPNTRRSTSGFCVYLGDNLVSWSSKRQHVVSRSSAEAEYRGIANVVAETAWLRNLLLELYCPLSRATVVFCDNVSAMYLASNPVQHQRTKHVEIDLHFVRERVAIGHVRVLHVPSAYQYADIFTKGLPTSLFLDFRNSLNIRLPPDQTTGTMPPWDLQFRHVRLPPRKTLCIGFKLIPLDEISSEFGNISHVPKSSGDAIMHANSNRAFTYDRARNPLFRGIHHPLGDHQDFTVTKSDFTLLNNIGFTGGTRCLVLGFVFGLKLKTFFHGMTLDRNGYEFIGKNGVVRVKRGALLMMKALRKTANLYILQGQTVTGDVAVASKKFSDGDLTKLWHLRLGCMSLGGMIELSQRDLLDGNKVTDLQFCEHCVYGKTKRVRFSSGIHTTKGPLDYIHSDLWGLARVTSYGGASYMLTIIDDFSRRVWAFFLKGKSDVFGTFTDWRMMIEKQSGKEVKYLRTDNGLEFCSEEFNAYCRKNGITRHRTVAHTPQQNGVAERMNRTILEKKKTPMEVWSGSPADYMDLKIFGCPAYARVDNGKLEPRAIKCNFLGYKDGVKGFRLWCPETKKILISRDVTFDESSMLSDSPPPTSEPISESPKEKPPVEVELPMAQTSSPIVTNDLNAASSSTSIGAQVEDDSSSQTMPQAPEPCIVRDRGRREIVCPARYTEESDLVAHAFNVAEEMEGTVEPTSYSEAMKLDDADEWLMAMKAEMESLLKSGTWELVLIPKGKKAVRSNQIPGLDYNDIFSPVVKHTSIRALLGMVAYDVLELEQMDVTTAFLNGELEEEIFMHQPEGFVFPGKEGHVCKLIKSLYGLKQSPRQWYKRFDAFVTAHGLSNSSYDSCVYFKKCDDGSILYLLLYVDDMLIAAKDMGEVQKVKDQLNSEFDMKDLVAAKKILGMEIVRDRKARKLYLSQEGYVQKVLHHFGMSEAKSVNTPFAPHFRLSSALSPSTQADVAYMARVSYSSAVGSLMYAMICTRPDLAYAVSMVSRYMANPGKEHWKAVQWIFRYLKGTTNLCLHFGRNSSGVLGYTDSDYGKDIDNRRSITGYVFTLDGCSISWRAHLQPTVALSTTEAEYMAVSEAVKEGVWLKGFFGELCERLKVEEVFCDNQGAVLLTKDRVLHDRTKHIDIRHHYIREVVARGDLKVVKISTDDNAADMLTKPLPVAKFNLCLDLVGVEKRGEKTQKGKLHLSNDVLQDDAEEETSYQIWTKLDKMFMEKGLPNKLHMKLKLYALRLSEGGSITAHLSKFKEIVGDLKNLEVKYDDADLGLILLCSLPPSFGTFMDTIIYSRDSLSLDEVYTALSSKEQMKEINPGHEPRAEGLNARGRPFEKCSSSSSKSGSKSRGKPRKFRNFCKRKGHTMEECFKLQAKNKAKNKTSGTSGEADVVEQGEVGF